MRSNVSGVGFYKSEPRTFSQGFGRGNPRPSPSPQPPRKSDLFAEAGKLAVEYLVSHGLLSSNVIPGNQRSLNDQDTDISSSYSRERRKYGGSRSCDWSRENGRVGSLPEKTSSSQGMEVYDDKCPKDTFKEENSNVCATCSTESANKNGSHIDAEHETEMCRPLSLHEKGDEEIPKYVDEAKEERKDGTCNHEQKQKTHGEELPIELSENNNGASAKEKADVTKVHCFLSDKSLKNEPLLIREEINMSDTGRNFHDFVKDDNTSDRSEVMSLSERSCSNCPGNAMSDHSFRCVGASDPACGADQSKIVDSLSFTIKGFSHEEESIGLSELKMCSSAKKDTKEKRLLEEDHMTEGAKKAKQWLSVAQSNEYPQLSDLNEKKPISPKRDASIFNKSADQESFHDLSLPKRDGVESAMDRREEKQLFCSSYKICDLNLIEASDVRENRGVEGLLHPSLSSPKKEAQIDIDLSMSNNCTFISGYNNSVPVRKDFEIIDLESSSMEEGRSPKFSTKSAEAGITKMETFADNPQHTNDNPDGQDGYCLMISELLGNDIPNCSRVQPDLNSLQDAMGLHHGEGIFTEDDPIYMSLGEIPLTGLLQGWEQPTQEKNLFEL